MDIVTHSGFRVVKNLDGRKYTLAAPSFAQAGQLAELANTQMRPSTAVLLEETREALRRAGREALVAAIDEYEEAEDNLLSTDAMLKGDDSPDGKREMKAARDRHSAAYRARQRAEWPVRDDEALKSMRALANQLDRQEHLTLLSMCLVGWEGEGLPVVPEKISVDFLDLSLPSGDVSALGRAAQGLLRPTADVQGNSAPPSP